MKKIKYILAIFIPCFLVTIFLSEFVFAQTPPVKDSFCEMISKRVLSEKGAVDLGSSAEERARQRTQKEEERTEARKKQDERRVELYEYLESVAKTEEQKTAVEEFKLGSKKSVMSYREKQDLIIGEFRSGADSIYGDGTSSTESLLIEAKVACDSGKYKEDDIEEEFANRSNGAYVVGGKFREVGETLSLEMRTLMREKKQDMNVAKELFGAEIRDFKNKLSVVFK